MAKVLYRTNVSFYCLQGWDSKTLNYHVKLFAQASLFLSLFFVFLFFCSGSHCVCSPGWFGTPDVEHESLELTELPVSQVVELEVYTTMSGLSYF